VFCRFSLFSAVVSILCGALVFFLFSTTVSPDFSAPYGGGGYVILAFDESQDDRAIRETLARGGLEGFISESSQEIPIDDFGFLRMVPLDTFREKIEPFDPRDTGYAEMLRSFFVQGGQRFFFLHLEDTASGARVKNQAAALLPDIPFTFTVMGHRRSLFWYFPLLAFACVFALFISRSRRFFLPGLPVLLAFGWGGSSAFILAAVFVAILELLREPLIELSAARRYQRYDYAGSGFSGFFRKLKPFRVNCLFALLFLVFIVFFSVTMEISPIPLAAAFASLCLLYFLAFYIESERARKNRHILFIPVPMIPFKAKTFSIFPLLLPFGLASVMAVFLPLFVPDISPPGENEPPVDIRYLVSAEDYYRHVEFQRSFSFRRLDQEFHGETSRRPLIQDPFLRYYLGEDGLIAGSTGYTINFWEGAPFPLEKLKAFLLNYDMAPAAGTALFSILFSIKEWISVAMIFAAWILNLFSPSLRPAIRPWAQGKKSKKVPLPGDKRIAARKPGRQAAASSMRTFPHEGGRRLPS